MTLAHTRNRLGIPEGAETHGLARGAPHREGFLLARIAWMMPIFFRFSSVLHG